MRAHDRDFPATATAHTEQQWVGMNYKEVLNTRAIHRCDASIFTIMNAFLVLGAPDTQLDMLRFFPAPDFNHTRRPRNCHAPRAMRHHRRYRLATGDKRHKATVIKHRLHERKIQNGRSVLNQSMTTAELSGTKMVRVYLKTNADKVR